MRSLLVSVASAVLVCATTVAVAADKTYHPWELLSSGFGGSLRSFGYQPPVEGGNPAGTAYAGGDDGGVYRSNDCGDTWEHVNGGPPVSDGVAGGYTPIKPVTGIEDCACQPGVQSCDKAQCHHGMNYGGPPSAEQLSLDIQAITSSADPLDPADPAKAVTWRIAGTPYFSRNRGEQWYPLNPGCWHGSGYAHFDGWAVDAGKPRRVVASASDYHKGSAEASACGAYNACLARQIAWTDDIRPQMTASTNVSDIVAHGAEFLMDQKSQWHYASLNHLATSSNWQDGNACAAAQAVIESDPKKHALPTQACKIKNNQMCHGTTPKPERELACLDQDDPGCKCENPPVDSQDHSICRYPIVTSLQTDPRNGFVYATTESGLLLSVDGGRSWGRSGPGDPVPALRPDTIAGATAGPYPQAPRVLLLTGAQGNDPDFNAGAYDNVLDIGVDLNKVPWRIASMGKMSWSFTPATCGIDSSPLPDGRPRGNLTAYLPISWHMVDANGREVLRSSVFVAHGSPCDNPASALVFRDVNTAKDWGLFFGVPFVTCTAETDTDLAIPKLPRSQQYDAKACYYEPLAPYRCPMRVSATALAPSNPQIVYAAMKADAGPEPDCAAPVTGDACNAVPKPAGCTAPPAYTPYCQALDGLYQSLDGGMTWSLVLGRNDPQARDGFANEDAEGLAVSAANPYVVWLQTLHTQYRIAPIAAAPGQPASECGGTCQFADNNGLANWNTAKCTKTSAVSNLCGWLRSAAPPLVIPSCPTSIVGKESYCAASNYDGPNAADALPPQCAHRFPSHPDNPVEVEQRCQDCTQLNANAGLCSEAFSPLGNFCSASGACGWFPVRCCVGVVSMQSVSHAADACNALTEPGRGQARGASEEWVYDATVATVPSIKSVPLPNGGVALVESVDDVYLVGADDVGGHSAGQGGDSGASSKNSVWFRGFKWKLADGTNDLTTEGVFAGPDTVFEYATFQGTGPADVDLWALANGSKPDFYYALIHVQGQSARRLGNLFPPPPGTLNPYFAAYGRQEISHKRLRPGPPGWLFASVPVFGVAAVDTVAASAPAAIAASQNGKALAQGVTLLANWEGQVRLPMRQPRVEDIAYDGKGWLWAVVGPCVEAASTYPKCSAQADPPVAPGVYVHAAGPEVDPNWLTSAWIRVPQPALRDPFVLRVGDAKAGDGTPHRVLLVGNWTLPGGDCSGGLYSLDLSSFDVSKTKLAEPSLATLAAAMQWRLISRVDGVSALDLSPQLAAPAPSAATSIWVALAEGTRLLDPAKLVMDRRSAATGTASVQSGAPVVQSPAMRPGVYQIADALSGSPVNQVAAGTTPTCAAFVASLDPAKLVDCGARTHTATCKPVEGATSSADHGPADLFAAQAKGLAHASLHIGDVEAARLHYDSVLVGTWRDGAFRLIETAGPTPKQLATDAYAYYGKAGANGSVLVDAGFAPGDDWRVEFAELNLRYTYPVADDDPTGQVLVNGTALPCPYSDAVSCLPGTGLAGGSRVHTFLVPAIARMTSPSTVSLQPSAGPATASEASLVVARAPLLTTLMPVTSSDGTGHVYAPTLVDSPARLRLFATSSLPVAAVELNGQRLALADHAAVGVAAIVPGLWLHSGDNVLRAFGESGEPVVVEWTEMAVASGTAGDQLDVAPASAHPGLRHVALPAMRMRRGAFWAEITLADPSLPTLLVHNGAHGRFVQDGVQVGGNVYRVLMDTTEFSGTTSHLEARTWACSAADPDCRVDGNLVGVRVIADLDDNPLHCLARPETCNAQDDDCDGMTDETTGTLCDGPDADGCALGNATCLAGAACVETSTDATLAPVPSSLVLQISGIDAVFEDGCVVAMQNSPAQLDMIEALTNGAHIDHLDGTVSPNGSHHLLRFVLHLSSAPTLTRNGAALPVAVRSAPSDDGLTLTLDIVGGTDLQPGSHLILVGDNEPGALAVNTVFGCPDGELTFPSHLRVRNGCNFQGVDCSAATGPGSACDTSPNSIPCPGCSGDVDGCRAGHLLPAGADGALVCSADEAVSPKSPSPTALWVSLATATFYFDGGDPVTVTADPTPFDLFGALANPGAPIPAFMVPAPTAGHEGAKVTAIRMTLWGADSAQVPDGQGGAWTVIPRSGVEDSGLDIDLHFPSVGTGLQPGAQVFATAQAASGPDGWQVLYECSASERTIMRRFQVVNHCETPGACGP